MTIVTETIHKIERVPTETLDFLEPYAVADGHSKTRAAVARYAIIWAAKQIRNGNEPTSREKKRA